MENVEKIRRMLGLDMIAQVYPSEGDRTLIIRREEVGI